MPLCSDAYRVIPGTGPQTALLQTHERHHGNYWLWKNHRCLNCSRHVRWRSILCRPRHTSPQTSTYFRVCPAMSSHGFDPTWRHVPQHPFRLGNRYSELRSGPFQQQYASLVFTPGLKLIGPSMTLVCSSGDITLVANVINPDLSSASNIVSFPDKYADDTCFLSCISSTNLSTRRISGRFLIDFLRLRGFDTFALE